MIVHGDGGLRFDQAGRFTPRSRLPVVFAFFRRNPRRQRLIEISGQGEDVRLVHAAQIDEALIGSRVVVQLEAVLCEDIANVLERGTRQAVRRKFFRRSSACRSQAPSIPTMINAQESRMAVSDAIQDWLSCCERKNASTG